HAAGVLHRDLKPANVMVSDGGARVLDFGLAHLTARAVNDGPDTGAGGDSRLTDADALIGTPTYIAPEVIRDPHAATAASDVYARAAVAYEALAGRPPSAGTTRDVLRAHLHDPPPPLSLPAAAWDALAAGLAKDVQGRPPDAGALIRRLDAALRAARDAERE